PDADRAIEEPVDERLPPVVAGTEEELLARSRVDEQDPRDQREPDAVPGDAPADGWRPAVLVLVVLGGAEALGLETKHHEQQREARRDEALKGREPLLHVSPRPCEASPG